MGKDRDKALPGQWVLSQELRVGDVIAVKEGEWRRIERIDHRFEEAIDVYNLTVRDHHTFAVGAEGILVHNDGWCDLLLKAKIQKPQALLDLAKKGVIKARQIHGHHMVQKTRGLFYWKQGTKSWYIWQSQKKLAELRIPLLKNLKFAQKLANRGKPLHNLTWAINGRGTHSKATVISVYNKLMEAADRGAGIDALQEIAKILNNGNRFRYGI